jgi:hypothetical protein
MEKVNITVVITALLLGTAVGITNGTSLGFWPGATSGFIAGFLYIIIINPLSILLGKKLIPKVVLVRPSMDESKEIIFDAPANHFQGIAAVGGWLFLTPEELYFKAHSMNIRNHELTIPLARIAEVKPVSTLGLAPNGLKITTVDHQHYRFVVAYSKFWAYKISEAKQDFMIRQYQP